MRRLGGTAGGVAGPGVDASIGLPGLARPGVETGIGVLRPTLARAAGRAADAALSWMTPPGYDLASPGRITATCCAAPAPRVHHSRPGLGAREHRRTAGRIRSGGGG
ncbi:hypothetical protein OG818_13695 [Streptomyces virginiae]|uniref:hypothetical protein n=1 Tax=Streptomyces virginiae TaxID=1961 RepID=UPI00225A7C51|nr:hypothetical protein [Streptomyces virginiae]MCX4716856.1 hypothetical protein [Streptomyces virginiae]